MITKYIIGDITETELKYIAHGVNCQNKMGSGVAKALYSKFPKVKEVYHEYFKCFDDVQVGEWCFAVQDGKEIYNLFTQEYYGYDGKRYVNYAAIVECFKSLKESGKFDGPIAIPKIGCGLAGGDWNIVEQLINDTVGDDLEIWVYELEPKKYSKSNDLG